jgi:hypothetical protein
MLNHIVSGRFNVGDVTSQQLLQGVTEQLSYYLENEAKQ